MLSASLQRICLIVITKYVFIYFSSNNIVSLKLNKTIIIYSVSFGKRKCAPVMRASHIIILLSWNSGHYRTKGGMKNIRKREKLMEKIK